ncbi:protein kinase [Psychrobacter sp. H8-1]|uniref:protein kinase domain-containing protein n=1 Tax=Psychrobacter sp. H8-1 TaxID=2774129 RepID=UPI00191958E4|nr:protein kinase [Psychrobacter sp. H8-1]
MKDSVSNLASIPALQVQAVQILPPVTAALSKLGYAEIVHQRIAQQNTEQNVYDNDTIYQGLTRAQQSQFGRVMIKWQLDTHRMQQKLGLPYEVGILKELNHLCLSQTHAKPVSFIAPPVLSCEALQIQVLQQSWQLSLLTMPYYTNGSLASLIDGKKHRSLIDKHKQQLILQAAHLINNLHQVGWLHNDIKPSNILLEILQANDADNSSISFRLLLNDFALAERFERADENNRVDSHKSAGTPAYLAPERWQGQSATLQSDIYAFGIMMYQLLIGERPFKVASQSSEPLRDWALQHCQQPIPSLPIEYEHYQTIINQTLAKHVEKRYRSMEEVLRDLKNLHQ